MKLCTGGNEVSLKHLEWSQGQGVCMVTQNVYQETRAGQNEGRWEHLKVKLFPLNIMPQSSPIQSSSIPVDR